jgi:hypothetical protein
MLIRLWQVREKIKAKEEKPFEAAPVQSSELTRFSSARVNFGKPSLS